MVLVGWGFGSPQLTLYTYRALESILHVYPGARVRFITTGERAGFSTLRHSDASLSSYVLSFVRVGSGGGHAQGWSYGSPEAAPTNTYSSNSEATPANTSQ